MGFIAWIILGAVSGFLANKIYAGQGNGFLLNTALGIPFRFPMANETKTGWLALGQCGLVVVHHLKPAIAKKHPSGFPPH